MALTDNVNAELLQLRNESLLLHSINDSIELDELLDILGSEIEKTDLFDAYLINLADSSHDSLVCEKIRLPKGYQNVESTYRKYNFSLEGDFIHADSYAQNKAVIIDESSITSHEAHVRNRFERWEIRQLITVPIQSLKDDRSLGIIMAFRQHEDLAPESEFTLRTIIAPFIPRLKAALKYNELKSRQIQVDQIAAEQTRFLEFVTTINNLTSNKEIYKAISHEFLRLLPFEHVTVMMQEDDKIVCKKNTARNGHCHELCERWDKYLNEVEYDLDIADGATSTVILNNSHLFFPDVMKVLHLPMSDKDKNGLNKLSTPRTFLFMPIRHNGHAIGLIWLISLSKIVSITDEEIKLVELLCGFIGTAIKNAEVYDLADKQKNEIEILNQNLQDKVYKLAEMASKDKLTGLYNFRSFEIELDRRIDNNLVEDTDFDLALVILDIDHFKTFNDTYGHTAGNVVLAGVAQQIRGLARQKDIAYRYGGEEFVIILPRCDIDGAKLFAERVRQTIQDSSFDTESKELSVTVSVGFGCHKAQESREQLFERVDQALYRAKHQGRNRIETAV